MRKQCREIVVQNERKDWAGSPRWANRMVDEAQLGGAAEAAYHC